MSGKLNDLETELAKVEKHTRKLASALYKLGEMYYYGKGVENDYSKAVRLWTKAAEQGHAEAVRWVTKAAEQEDAYAQEWVDKITKKKEREK